MSASTLPSTPSPTKTLFFFYLNHRPCSKLTFEDIDIVPFSTFPNWISWIILRAQTPIWFKSVLFVSALKWSKIFQLSPPSKNFFTSTLLVDWSTATAPSVFGVRSSWSSAAVALYISWTWCNTTSVTRASTFSTSSNWEGCQHMDGWLELMVHYISFKAEAESLPVFFHPCWSTLGVLCDQYQYGCDPIGWLFVQWCINPTHAPTDGLRGVSKSI